MNEYVPYTKKAESELDYIGKLWHEKTFLCVLIVLFFLIIIASWLWIQYGMINKLKSEIVTLNSENSTLKQSIEKLNIEINTERQGKLHAETRLKIEETANRYFPGEPQDRQITLLIERFDLLVITLKTKFPDIDTLNLNSLASKIEELYEVKNKFDELTKERILSEAFKSNFNNIMSKYPEFVSNIEVEICGRNDNRESLNYAKQIENLFKENKWKVIPCQSISLAGTGIVEIIYPSTISSTNFISDLKDIFNDEGLSLNAKEHPYGDLQLIIEVGTK